MESFRAIPVIAILSLVSLPLSARKAPDASPQAQLEQTAIANEKNLIEAKKKDDELFLKRTLSAEFAMVAIDGTLITGEEAAGAVGDSGLVEFTPYNMKVVPLGEGGVIVTYDAIVRVAEQEDQGPPPRYQHFSSTWIKQNGEWKLKFQQTTAVHWGDW